MTVHELVVNGLASIGGLVGGFAGAWLGVKATPFLAAVIGK